MRCAILIVLSALAIGARSDCIDAEALAAVIDKALKTVDSEGPESVEWDPVHADKIFTISTGEIFGLKSMKRVSTPEIKCLENRFASVKVTVRMTNVKIVYPWKLNGILKHSGKVYGDTEFIEGDVYFIRSSNEDEPMIFNKFDITEVGPSTARVTGASYITWITSHFVTQISHFLKNTVGDALENQVGHTICDVLNKVEGVRKVIDNIH